MNPDRMEGEHIGRQSQYEGRMITIALIGRGLGPLGETLERDHGIDVLAPAEVSEIGTDLRKSTVLFVDPISSLVPTLRRGENARQTVRGSLFTRPGKRRHERSRPDSIGVCI